jgi:hypothetical protein
MTDNMHNRSAAETLDRVYMHVVNARNDQLASMITTSQRTFKIWQSLNWAAMLVADAIERVEDAK